MNRTDDRRPRVGITMGDPAGVGPEVVAKGYRDAAAHALPIVVGDAAVLEAAIGLCDLGSTVRVVDDPAAASDDPGAIDVLDLDNVDLGALERGVVDEDAGRASLEYVERAIELATAGSIDAITTAPIDKRSTRRAGSDYAGHTGLLADRTGADTYSMLLVHGPLRVTHVSTHVSLREACDLVTDGAVFDTIRVTDDALRALGIDAPRIGVAGLNPHAGDGGLFGEAEEAEIAPAVERARAAGVDAVGPEPPDTVFGRAVEGAFDCVVSMYHDQGHVAIKTLGYAEGEPFGGVNVTIGLPIVRTSVDHGTAFDVAGEGIASETSLVNAVALAAELSSTGADRNVG